MLVTRPCHHLHQCLKGATDPLNVPDPLAKIADHHCGEVRGELNYIQNELLALPVLTEKRIIHKRKKKKRKNVKTQQ